MKRALDSDSGAPGLGLGANTKQVQFPLPTVRGGIASPQNSYIKILTTRTSECDLNWKQDFAGIIHSYEVILEKDGVLKRRGHLDVDQHTGKML